MSRRILDCPSWSRGSWPLLGRSQSCCSSPCNTWAAPTTETHPALVSPRSDEVPAHPKLMSLPHLPFPNTVTKLCQVYAEALDCLSFPICEMG